MSVMEDRGAARSALDMDSLQEYWHDQVFGLPSVFARLSHLSRLWDPAICLYHEPTLEANIGADGADRVIRTTHELSFAHWLAFNLEQQKADVEIYLHGARAAGAVPTVSLRPESYRALIPESALPHEQHLFLFDMAVIVELIQARPRGSEQPALRLVPARA